MCSDNDLRWKIRSKKSTWTIQNDFWVNTEWFQGSSRTCSHNRGEKQGKKGKWKFLFLSGFLVIELIKWLLQAISCGKLGTLKQPDLKKIFFWERRDPRGWSSKVNQQFGGFYSTQVLRGSTGRFWIFLFKISNINDKSCPGWPGLTPQRAIHTPENPCFASSCWGRFKNCFFKVEFISVFNS